MPANVAAVIVNVGPVMFGIVIGWVLYRTLRRKTGGTNLSDLSSVIGVIGGAAITQLYGTAELFALYCVGLFLGFFGYLVVAKNSAPDEQASGWMGR